MKKILAVFFMVMFMFASWAQAFTVLDEVQVVPPPQNKTQKTQVAANRAAPAQKFKVTDEMRMPPRPTEGFGQVSSFNEEKFNKKLNRLLAASREKFTKVVDDQNQAIMLKIENLSKKFDDSKTLNDSRTIAVDGKLFAIDEQAKKLTSTAAEIKKVAETNGEKIANLDAKLTGEDGEFAKLKGELGATSNWSFVVTVLVGIALILGFIIVAVAVFVFVKNVKPAINAVDRIDRNMAGIGTKIDAVQTAVEEIPAKVKALDPLTVDLKDVLGHHVVYSVPIVDGMYVTPYVPSSVTKPVADPTQIEQFKTADKQRAIGSTRQAMKRYFLATAPGAPAPTTEQERQQIARINHLKDTGKVSWS